jgi:hypothetical protein
MRIRDLVKPGSEKEKNQNRDKHTVPTTLAKTERKHGTSMYQYKMYMIRSFTVDVEGK